MSQENILYGPPEFGLENSEKSLAEYFFENLTIHGNKTSQVDAKSGKSRNNDEILSLSLRLAENLRYGVGSRRLHIACGDCISMFSENSIDYCIPVLAAFYLGAAAAPLNIHYSKGELKHIMNISKPKLIFASKSKLNDIVSIARSTDFVQAVIIMDEIVSHLMYNQMRTSRNEDFIISINELLYPKEKFNPSLPLAKDFPKVHIKKQNALLMCSSGTTGMPKVVMLTQFNLLFWMVMASMNVDPDTVTLGALPFFHVMGIMALLRTLFSGLKMIVLPHFDKKIFLESIEKHKVTVLNVVPPLAVMLAKDPLVAKYDFSSISLLSCGAAPLGKELQQEVADRINKDRAKIGAPPCRVLQGYGLTEATVAVCIDRGEKTKYGSVGTLVPGIQCKVVDLETGKSLGANKEGELCIRGPMIMKGYLNDQKATSNIIDADGWLHTGDIGYYDDEGYIFIVDRIKELIKYKGFQVPPAELEAILQNHPSVEDAAVIGIPDQVAGELPMAIVVKKQGKELSEAEVIKFVADHVSPQKRLRGGVKFVKSIPKTASGKILRRVLRESFKSKL